MIVYFYIWVFTLPFRLQRMVNNRLANMYARIDERYKYPIGQNDNFDYCLNPKCKSCRKLDQKLSQAETARRYLFTAVADTAGTLHGYRIDPITDEVLKRYGESLP